MTLNHSILNQKKDAPLRLTAPCAPALENHPVLDGKDACAGPKNTPHPEKAFDPEEEKDKKQMRSPSGSHIFPIRY